ALALVAQHLEQQIAIFRRQGVALVEAVRGCDGALEARQGIARRVDAAPERPSIEGRAYRNGRRAAIVIGGARAVRGGRRALVATNAAQEPRRVEVRLTRDKRLGHAGQQAVADVADVGAACGAAQAVVGAVRGGLIHGDAGRRVRPPDVIHGPYLSPGLPPRLQTWKTPPYAPPPAAPWARKIITVRWHRVCKTSRRMKTMARLALVPLVLLPLAGCASRTAPAAAQAPADTFIGEVWTWDARENTVTLRQGSQTFRVKTTPDQMRGLQLH